MNKLLSFLVISSILVLSGCSEAGAPKSGTFQFSFEHDMQGWTVGGTDLDNPPVEWSIERSQDIASDGNTALRFYLNNVNDAGKIWIEKPFDVDPSRFYGAQVEYDLASADWGDMNLWTIITGVISKPPKEKGGLVYQGATGNSAREEEGFVWLHKSYGFNVRSNEEGKLYAVIGFWGTWETARTYYVDNINVTITSSAQDLVPAVPTGLENLREEYGPTDGRYGDELFLTWDANTESNLKEYRIYRSLKRVNKEEFPKTSFIPIATTTENTYVGSNLTVTEEYPTTIFYYKVSAVDEAGNESPASEEVAIEYILYG